MTDRDGLCKKLQNCPPEHLDSFVERNYKKRLPGGGWQSPLNVQSLDQETIREYLKQKRANAPKNQSVEGTNLMLGSTPPRPADFLPETITAGD